MTLKNHKFLKLNRINRKKIFIVMGLIVSFLMIPLTQNLKINPSFNENGKKEREEQNFLKENLKTQGISSDNTFSGIGAPWNVSHWANRTDYDIPVEFENGTTYTVDMDLGTGWEGYKLNGTIKDLYDKRNWVNGTFEAGNDDNNGASGDNDDYKLVNWTFHEDDIVGYNNVFSGNYFDSASAPFGVSSNCMELRMDGYDAGSSSWGYDKFDKCWWETIFTLPRGNIKEGDINLVMYPWTQYNPQGGGTGEYGTHWSVQIIINGVLIDDKNLVWIELTGNNGWAPLELQLTNWLDDPIVFPTGVKTMNLTLQLIRNGATLDYNDYGSYQQVLIDNVTINLKGEVNATQIGLQMNEKPVSNIDWGNGTVEHISSWTETPVEVKFNSTETRPFEMGGYEVEFKTDINIFARKMSDNSDYKPNFDGTSFTVRNNSFVEWESYARVSVPTGYEETNMTIAFPEDMNITFISNAEYPDTNILKYCDNSTSGILKVFNFSETPDGFWWLKGASPNYCNDLKLYNNFSGSWQLNNTFLSGHYINITGEIGNTAGALDISNYIENTKARLDIKFPNGSIWNSKSQTKKVNNTGMVYFDPILIPSNSPNYEVGTYQAIITWNNSYPGFNLNETGIIYKTFMVTHNSTLIPDETSYSDIYEGEIVTLKVSYYDPKNDKPIVNATLTAKNFSGDVLFFDEVNPGYYWLEFNTSEGVAGNNIVTINATHPLYKDNQVNITIEVIYYTSLTAEEFPSIEVPWNNNATIHLNYTLTSDGSPILNANPTVYWNGDFSIKSGNGLYNVTCNTSKYQVNTAPNLRVEFDESGYESQTIIISIEVVERDTSITEIFINRNNCTTNKTANVNSGEMVNITVQYIDNNAGENLIHNAFVTLNGTGIGEVFEDNNNYYNLTFNSTKLGVGIFILNIIAQKDNYTTVTEKITISVYIRETDYWVYLNGVKFNQTQNPSIPLYKNQLLNVTFTYNDTLLKEHIPGATVDINGSGISKVLPEAFNNYSVLIDTDDLNQGVNFLTIFARKDGYKAHSVLVIVEIIQIQTNLTLYIDGKDITKDPSITKYPGEIINITVSYNTSSPVIHIPSATIDINGSGISEVLPDAFNNYSVLIDTDDLNQGANVLSIYARKDGYEPQTISLVIEIIQIETSLTLFVDGMDITADPSITRYPSQILNITVSYNRSSPINHISGATIDINGSGISEFLPDAFNNYSVLIDTDDLNQGPNFLTIYARKEGYEPQTILLVIQISQIETDLTLFVDGGDITANPSITRYPGQVLNITVSYNTSSSKNHISGATIDINGSGISEILPEAFNDYSVLIYTDDLTQGANFLSIYARKEGYEPQTILLTIEIVQIETDFELILNGENFTLNEEISITIRKSVNLTVKYTDQNGVFIPNASVSLELKPLVGEVLSWNLMKHSNLDQYYIIINTTDLELDTNPFTLKLQKPNYRTITKDFNIYVKPISVEIKTLSGTSQIEAEVGDNLLLQIILNDTIFGEDIPNATIAYTWLYGKGEDEDSDNDGIFEIPLENVREGIHTITITADAGEYYSFESYTITLFVSAPTVSPGPDLSWIIYVLGAGIVGLVTFFTLYQTHFKYPPLVRKIRKLKKKIGKAKSTKPILVNKRDEIINNELQNQIKNVEYEIIQPEQVDKVEKVIMKEGGEK
ncbi:MAG: hypothetical protein ACFFDH_05135 [Promethearchaeota archaeon]